MRSFFTNAIIWHNDIYRRRNREEAVVEKKLVEFIKEGKYSPYKYCSTMSSMILDGASDEAIADKLFIATSTVRVHKKNLSDALYKILGDDFFSLVERFSENWAVIEKRIEYARKPFIDSVSLIPTDIRLALSGVDPVECDISECEYEWYFLFDYSIPCMKERLAEVDSHKLKYLLNIIDGVSGDIDVRRELIQGLLDGLKSEAE